MRVDELDFDLPESAIATVPAEPRDHARLLVYRRAEDRVEHRRFFELPALLRRDDLLVVNNTKVVPAKLELHKRTGAQIPGLFLQEITRGEWAVMLRSRGKLKEGDVLLAPRAAGDAVELTLLARLPEKGQWHVRVALPLPALELLQQIGHTPLPPYIERARKTTGTPLPTEQVERERYQTVYAQTHGSLAAPTAGLHFTPGLLEQLQAMGVARAEVTLNVGLGTFLPVEAATLEEHRMHTEEYAVPRQTVERLRQQRAAGQRIVVIGTTAVRTLEACAGRILDLSQPPEDLRGSTDLLIQPGYHFALTDALITNFHLPRSTLLALVGALVGLPRLKSLYGEAIAHGYRFYSYGDAMLIL